MRIEFYDNFTLDDIPNNVIINMFDNIDNRIQYIESNDTFILIRRVSDNRILKSKIKYEYDNN